MQYEYCAGTYHDDDTENFVPPIIIWLTSFFILRKKQSLLLSSLSVRVFFYSCLLMFFPPFFLHLQCFPPARRWTSTATTANVSAAPGCATETTTARTIQTNRTVVSTLPLFYYDKQTNKQLLSHTDRSSHTERGPAPSSSGGRVIKVDRCLRRPGAERSLFLSLKEWTCCHAQTHMHTLTKRSALPRSSHQTSSNLCP